MLPSSRCLSVFTEGNSLGRCGLLSSADLRHTLRGMSAPRRPRVLPVTSTADGGLASQTSRNQRAPVSSNPREQLLDLASRKEFSGRHEKIAALLLELENLPSGRPATSMFTGFVLAGEWRLVYSTSPIMHSDGISLRSAKQSWDPEKKTVLNSCFWSYRDTANPKNGFDACMDIVSAFEFLGDGALVKVTLQSHQMRLVEREDGLENGPLPPNLQIVLQDVQRAMPADFWDPTGVIDPTTYVDPTFRISCVVSERFRNVRSVLTRC